MGKLLALVAALACLLPGAGALGTALPAELGSIRITAGRGALRVELDASAPLTYTYYKPAPLQAVVDLAQVVPGPALAEGEVPSEHFLRIAVEKREMAAFTMTRIIFTLKADLPMAVQASPGNRGRLLVTFGGEPAGGEQETAAAAEPLPGDAPEPSPGPPAAAPATTPAAQGKAPEPAAPLLAGGAVPAPQPPAPVTPPAAAAAGGELPKSAPLPARPALKPVVPAGGSGKGGNAVKVDENAIRILFRAANAKIFRLAKPDRLVVDIPGPKGTLGAREQPIGRFGIRRVRVGVYPDKVRLVFDPEGESIPPYSLERTASGLTIRFRRGGE